MDEVSQVLHREYLLCLVKAAEIEGGVPHLLSKGAYCNLLEGKPVRTRRKAEAFATLEVGQAVRTALPTLHASIGARHHRKRQTQASSEPVAASQPPSPEAGAPSESDSNPDDLGPGPPSPGLERVALSPAMPETHTDVTTEVTVKSQFSSSIPTTQWQEAETVDFPDDTTSIKYVESRAGGLVDGCGHEGCYEEANCACPACTVMLCDFHNGLFGPQHLTSRCHEHNPGDFARLLCPCPECHPPTAVTQTPPQVASRDDNSGQQAQATQPRQSRTSSSSSTPSSSSSASVASSSSSSSSSTDSEAGSGSTYAESSTSERSAGHPASQRADEAAGPQIEDEHAARGVLLETTSFWKTCRFTVVKDKGLEVGLEVTCRDPRHRQKGLPACRRTLRFAKYGGPVQVQRLLKWWLLQSHGYSTREAHVLHCPKAPDHLPTSEQLEAEQLSYQTELESQPPQEIAERMPKRRRHT